MTHRRDKPGGASANLSVRGLEEKDLPSWWPLWDGYNAFYGRSGATALDKRISSNTLARFFDASEPVHALVAELDGRVVGFSHYLFHRHTTRLRDVCYLQDLFTDSACRGRGVGRALIEAVYARARAAGSSRVYWATHTSNSAGRTLYEKVAEHRGFIIYGHELQMETP